MQIIVQDLLVNYHEQGNDDKTILLLHGWADRLETFHSLMPSLSQSYRTLALDLPGFGKTEAPKKVWNLDDYALFVADFVKKVDASNNLIAIVGHSNGGAVAIRGIALDLLAPEKLVLLASSGVRDTAKIRRLVIKAIAKIGKVATFWLPQKTKKRLQKKLYGTVGSDMLVTPQLQETFKKTVRQDIQSDAIQLNLPTLLIYGEEDNATPISSVGEKLHSLIKNSKLVRLPDADHFVHQAKPKQVGEEILEFLSL